MTGASSGIGLACAAALAEAGAQAAQGAGKLEELRAAFMVEGWTAENLPLDVADSEATAEAVAANGPFSILVNSAGLARHSAAMDTTAADFDAVMGVNLRGAYFLTQAVARGLFAAGKPGSLINISSQMGQVGGVERAVLCASKHAVEAFTKAMAIKWGRHGIRVNTIGPTFIRTPLTKATFDNPERMRWVEEKIKLGRVGEVEDVMGAATYLSSDPAALVTGTALLVDGG